MKVKIPICGLVVSVLMLSGCDIFKAQQQPKKTGLVVVNVLDKELFDDCHIKGSINIPFDSLEIFDDLVDKSAEIVCYCSNYYCSASGQTCKMLKERGFKQVFAYEAGMAEWFQEKLPVEGPCKSSYLTKIVSSVGEHDSEISLITTRDLALKMGMLPNE